MRFLDLVFGLVEKFAPMTEQDRTDLRNDAANDYSSVKATVYDTITRKPKDNADTPEKVKALAWKQKAVLFGERWYVRLGLAVLYIILVPVIQDYISGKKEDEDEAPL